MHDTPPHQVAEPGVRPALLFLALLVVADLAFIGADLVLNVLGPGVSPTMSVSEDQGHPEFFQYTKLAWAMVLLVVAARSFRAWNLLVWIPLFGYLLVDDATRFHEVYGSWIGNRLGIPPMWGLRTVDFGELIVNGAVGLVLVGIIALGLIGATPPVRRLFLQLAGLMVLLLVFGVAVDIVHMLMEGFWWRVFGLVEDGGEMLVVSLVTASLFRAALTGTPWSRPRAA